MPEMNRHNTELLRALALQQGKMFSKMSRLVKYLKKVAFSKGDPARQLAAISRKLAATEKEIFSDGRGTWDELTEGSDG